MDLIVLNGKRVVVKYDSGGNHQLFDLVGLVFSVLGHSRHVFHVSFPCHALAIDDLWVTPGCSFYGREGGAVALALAARFVMPELALFESCAVLGSLPCRYTLLEAIAFEDGCCAAPLMYLASTSRSAPPWACPGDPSGGLQASRKSPARIKTRAPVACFCVCISVHFPRQLLPTTG